MAPIWYRVVSQLRARRAGAVTVALLVAVVGALVLTLAAGVLRTLSTPDRYTAAVGDAYDISLEQFSGHPRVDEVEALPAVAAVEMATFVFGGVFPDGSEAPVDGFLFAGSPRPFGAVVDEGRAPDPTRPGEFVATRSWLAESGARLGDQFEARTITQGQADELGFDVPEPAGPTLPATLVGVITGATELQDSTPLALFPAGLLDVGDVGVASSVGVIALSGDATVDDLRSQLDALPAGQAFGLDTAEWVPADVRDAVRAQAQGLAVVAVIVAVASLVVVGQLLSRHVRLSDSHRVALGAMGLTRAQIIGDSLSFAALPVVIGSVLAAALAVAASGVFPVGFAARVEPAPGVRLDPLSHIVGAGLLAAGLLAWVLVALLLGSRERLALHRPGPMELLATRLRPGPAATGVRFALTRHPRDPGSVRAPVLGLVPVLGVLVGALTFGASVNRFIDEPARYGANFDFATGAGGDAVAEPVRELLEADPDVADLTLYGTLLTSVGSVSLDVTGMQPLRGTLEPEVLEGRLAERANEIVLGRVAARQLGVEVDEELTVVGVDGSVTFRVTGLAVIPSVEGGDGIGEGAVVTLDGFRRLDPGAAMSMAAVRLRSGATGAEERIGEMFGMTVGPPERPSTVVNLQRVRSTPFIVAASLAALAALSMAHQLITSARRRRRDLAVLRALGADRRWITRVLHWQATVLAAAVAVVALPLGVAAGRLVYRAYIDRIGARTDVDVPYRMLTAVVMSLLVLVNLAAIVPARRARDELPARVLGDE
ncbi:MAG: FtsX-like permease family protein [Acidimicrobiales bacterium]